MTTSRGIPILVAGTLAACSSTAPYEPQARVYAAHYAACRVDQPATAANLEACTGGAKWLEFQGQIEKARGLHERICEMGGDRSCTWLVEHYDDPTAAWRLCSLPGLMDIRRCALGASRIPANDPRRVEAMDLHCTKNVPGCIELLGIELALDAADAKLAGDLCFTAADEPDVTTCTMILTLPWAQPAVTTGLGRQMNSRGCAETLGNLCMAAARALDDGDPAHIAPRRALLERGCARRRPEACTAATDLATSVADRARCRAGETAACARVGADVAARARTTPR